MFLLKLWLLFVCGECLFWQRQPFGLMSMTDECFHENSHIIQCENRESKKEENEEKRRSREKWDGKERRRVMSLVQVNERWKHKEAVLGCGGLNREDWQKQSSSIVGCLNLHRCCYTPSTPHQSPLMISNITQSFVIALELNQHCSLWLTLLSFNCLEIQILLQIFFIQSQLGLVRGEGLSFWLKLTHWQQNIASATTQLRRICYLPIYRKVGCIVGRHERWNGATCLHWNTINHVGFCACLTRMFQNNNTRPPEPSHTHPNTNSDTCLRI